MAVRSFQRGLKLNTRKHVTEGMPIETAVVSQVVIPINQHFGAPNKAVVNAGDKVIRGQIIADAVTSGPMTSPVHASISGIVKKIEPRTQSNNTDGLCIIIEAEKAEEKEADPGAVPAGEQASEMFMPPLDPFSCSKEAAIGRIRDAGIIGMGGAGFPAHVKFNPPPGKTIDLIIANGAECEPYLTTDEAVIAEKPQLLIAGLTMIMKITGVKKAIIGMEDNKAALVSLLEQEIRLNKQAHSESFNIGIGLCKTRYPQGGEKMLIKALTGREVPSGGLPMDVHCIVSNVGTLIAVAEAFIHGKPLIDRDLTISGGACKKPKNMRLPIGTLITQLPAETIAIDDDYLRKIIFGGPMMGNAVATAAIPVQKNTSGIVLMKGEETQTDPESACIRCGRCIRNCPCRLSPVIMNISLESSDMDEAARAGLVDCIECGSCSYVCPARIKLVQRFRVGKQRLRAMKAMSQLQAQAEKKQEKGAVPAETVTGSANPGRK
ncbi:MAG: electron transport complex subunit RsxC [Treponema sp.]|nr:electron transport complex subunit RsxC [Treponema sp.]